MNRFIIADASKCIGCRTCEVACVVSHQENQDCASLTPETFLPRIHVIKGVNISTATVCRQCEDAPCANVCPNGAISRDKGFVHVMQERCIGCKTCVVACPYGAMEVVVRPVIRNSGAGLNVRADKAEANKCDLCNHREDGPACMAACPTHALICVDRNKLEQLSAEKRRRTALMPGVYQLYHGIYFSELLFHAARMAEEKGRQLLLADGKHSAEEERQAIQYLLDLRCDAIMIYPRFLSVDEIDDIIDAHSQPIMVLNRRLRKNSSHSVWCDHKQTSFNAVAELINAGHQEIAFLTGSMDSPTSIERLAGYKDALAQHGIALNEKLIANGKWTPASGAEGVEMLLERGAKFSALVASNDDMAIGAMKALHERGVAVPEQVSVIGFDDIAIAPYTVPALSSVKIPVTEMIQEIIGRLIFMLDGGDFSPPKTFSGKLIRRDSLIAPSR